MSGSSSTSELVPPSSQHGTRRSQRPPAVPTTAAAAAPCANPFSGRDNFPAWEAVIGVVDPNNASPPDLLDQSMYSQASSMNLSIGARAALNEHYRHVQKFGLDVTYEEDEDGEGGGNCEKQQRRALPTNPLDQEWDRLVDTSMNQYNNSILNDTILLESYLANEPESIEVMTNVSDYFNSSRVGLLGTPDRNRSRIHHAGRRGQEQSSLLDHEDDDDDSYEDDDESESDEHDQSLQHLFPQHAIESSPQRHGASKLSSPLSPTATDNSFSFSAVDISRISAAESETGGATATAGNSNELQEGQQRKSPNSSFHMDKSSSASGAGGGGQALFHQSFLSHVSSPAHSLFRQQQQSSPVVSPRRRDRGLPVTPKRNTTACNNEKENAALNMMGLSPIESRAGTKNVTGGGVPAIQLAASFAAVEDDEHEHVVPNVSLSSCSSSGGPILEYNRTHDNEISTLYSSSSTSSSAVRIKAALHTSFKQDDRRRYRTVVPTRVFLTGVVQPDDLPEYHDSFSAPSPTAITQPCMDSSFDAMVQRSGYSDPT